jgi:hypothetical protein
VTARRMLIVNPVRMSNSLYISNRAVLFDRGRASAPRLWTV